VVEGVVALVDQSLVQREPAPGGARFGLLETVREFALAQLAEAGEAAAAARRHAAFYAGLAEAAAPALAGPDPRACLDRLERDLDNLRAALRWLVAGGADPAAGLRLAAALWPLWDARGRYAEGRRWLEAALGADGGPAPWRAGALLGLGGLAGDQGGYPVARARLEESLALSRAAGDAPRVAAALKRLGDVARHEGDLHQAAALHRESLERSRALGDTLGVARSIHGLGDAARRAADHGAAWRHYQDALALF